MRQFTIIRALLLELLLCYLCAAESIRAIYLFKDVLKSNTTALTSSGFNAVIIFGVGILENGDIMYYSNTPGSSDVLVASSGGYVGGSALSEKVRSFKEQAGTSITRVEISMNAQHVSDLMRSPGPGADTNVHRNFAALRAAWGLDAVNNDDESLYDVAGTVAFAKMLGAIGYRYTIAPYTNSRFWVDVKTQVNGGHAEPDWLLDRVYLQCYDGGAGNDPAGWQTTLGMKVVPLIWVTNDSKPSQGTTATQARSKFAGWNSRSVLAGGGYWNDYDIEKMGLSYAEYGGVLTTIFP
ncbi:uncharacterized protein GGS25DRAFT_530721 [Hypoxylon fragiforme]|uniref:uncharacterized protein n=1 Tax=Hypoxylon fragiforme TaxID=63214 RepID=UPI0020C5F8DC|nr:uncharacterized protein GGS25DRAFT_530721 [Hypoxylon fragiforme]KAI2609638.1 hypothetical protein GGS25DRAFT_530721 [Hypoxylon fragiforme]